MSDHLKNGGHSDRQKFQADYYDGFADDFDAACNRENSNHLYKIEQIGETFFQNLPSSETGYDFMELGSGTGIHADHFLRAHAPKINSFLLTDISENMLRQAEKRLGQYADKVEYEVMPAEKFTTSKNFDGIFVSGSMHHFANPLQALQEMKSHLKPSGMVVICEPVVWNPVNFLKCLREIKAESGQFKTQRSNVRKILHELGYQIVTDRVLHYRSGNNTLRKLVPYQAMERYVFLNPMAIMFLFGAKAEG